MDMAARSAIFAGGLVILTLAAAAGWWLFGDDLFGRGATSPTQQARAEPVPLIDQREGSLYDEFGESSDWDDRITIRTVETLDLQGRDDPFRGAAPPPPEGTVAGLPSGPQFDWNRGEASAFEPGFERPSAPSPRTTAAERVEADCRNRGGGSYACRCLVRLARSGLTSAQFVFLSLSEEDETRTDRLSSAGLTLDDLPPLALELVALDANARRRCGAGLKL